MPFGDFINQVPAVGFLAIHLTAFLIGAYFAWRSFDAGATLLGWGFSLFAHTVSEVLDLVAFILIFAYASQRALVGSNAPATSNAPAK